MNKKLIYFLITLYFIIFFFLIESLYLLWNRKENSYKQPINFTHKIHLQKVKLKCNYCHNSYDKSSFAGMPSIKKCMDCHKIVKTESKEIKKLKNYYNKKLPIIWKKVYSLPEFVYFSHKRHIKASVKCSVCHGELEVMTTAKKINEVNMGWCVDCHRLNKAPTDCLTCHL